MTRQRDPQETSRFRVHRTARLALRVMVIVCLTAMTLATSADAQLQPGDIVVLMRTPGGTFGTSPAVLVQVDPITGARTVLQDFGNATQGPLGVLIFGMAVESPDSILVIDDGAGTSGRGALFRVTPSTGQRAIIHDFGDPTKGPLGSAPRRVTVEPSGTIVVADAGVPDGLFRVDLSTGTRELFSNFGNSAQGDLLQNPKAIAIEADGTILVNAFPNPGNLEVLYRVNPANGNRTFLADIGRDPFGTSTQMNPVGVAVEANGKILVIDSVGGSIAGSRGVLWRVDPANGILSPASEFDNLSQGPLGSEPLELAVESDGMILVMDQGGSPLRPLFRIDPGTGARTILSVFSQGAPVVGGIPVGVAVVLPTVTVTAFDPTATENPKTTGTFRVSRTGPTTAPVEVFYTVGGTATPGSDYTALPGSVTILAGASSADITVTPINDPLIEGAETAILTLSPRPTYKVGAPSSATVNITSEDKPVVTLTAPDPTAAENPPPITGTFRVSRTGPTGGSLTVALSRSGTAAAGSDYVDFGLLVTIPASAGFKDITLTPINDTLAEAEETVTLTVIPLAPYTVGTPNKATVRIISDEPVVTLSTTTPTATEAGLTPGKFTFTRTGSITAALTVNYTVTGTATAGIDYVSLGTSVAFQAGQSTVTKTVTPLQDNLQELDETVVVTLTPSPNYGVGSPSAATVTIVSDDPITQAVTVAATDATATEAGPTTGTFTFTRTGSTANALTVNYTVSGTATAGSDYVSLGTSVTFAPLATTTTKLVTPLQDTLQELNETVVLTLTQSPNYAVGSPASATVTIISDEPITQTVTVTASTPTAKEAGLVPGLFTFTRTGSTANALTVNYTVSGTASRSDYESLGTSVTFAAGATTATKPVKLEQDNLQELNETVVLTLTQSPNYAVGSPASATVTIISDEPITQTVTVTASTPTAKEAGLVPGLFTFTRTGNTTSALTVNYTVSGTATAGSDYQPLGTSVAFAAGATTATKTVTPLQDTLQELNETVVLTLSQSPNYAVGSAGSATVILVSDE